MRWVRMMGGRAFGLKVHGHVLYGLKYLVRTRLVAVAVLSLGRVISCAFTPRFIPHSRRVAYVVFMYYW